jgi:GAF domain-containing protein
VPLAAGEQDLGVLGVCFPQEAALSDEDRAYLMAIGGISSLAIAGEIRPSPRVR